MLKTLLLVVAGLVAGLALAYWLQPSSEPAVAAAPTDGSSRLAVGAARADERIADLKEALDAEILQRSALEDRVAELAAQLEALGQRPRFARDAGGASAPGEQPLVNGFQIRAREGRAGNQSRESVMLARLTAAGFAPDRAEWINRRSEELRMKTL